MSFYDEIQSVLEEVCQLIDGNKFLGFDSSEHSKNMKMFKTESFSLKFEYEEEFNELWIQIYETYMVNPFIDFQIGIEEIKSEQDLIKAIKEELESVIGHFQRMLEDLN